MTTQMRRAFGTLAVGGAALTLAGLGAGTAAAAPTPATVPSQAESGQSAFESGPATLGSAAEGLGMAAADRPEGVDGVETEVSDADYRQVEGPASGLLDGPFD